MYDYRKLINQSNNHIETHTKNLIDKSSTSFTSEKNLRSILKIISKIVNGMTVNELNNTIADLTAIVGNNTLPVVNPNKYLYTLYVNNSNYLLLGKTLDINYVEVLLAMCVRRHTMLVKYK